MWFPDASAVRLFSQNDNERLFQGVMRTDSSTTIALQSVEQIVKGINEDYKKTCRLLAPPIYDIHLAKNRFLKQCEKVSSICSSLISDLNRSPHDGSVMSTLEQIQENYTQISSQFEQIADFNYVFSEREEEIEVLLLAMEKEEIGSPDNKECLVKVRGKISGYPN